MWNQAGRQDQAEEAIWKFWKRFLGMFMEGPVEEGLQSAQEKIAENLALGRPWDEDVEGTFAEGSVSGAVMGAGANALPSKGKSKSAPTTEASPAAPLDADAWIKENALPEIPPPEGSFGRSMTLPAQGSRGGEGGILAEG